MRFRYCSQVSVFSEASHSLRPSSYNLAATTVASSGLRPRGGLFHKTAANCRPSLSAVLLSCGPHVDRKSLPYWATRPSFVSVPMVSLSGAGGSAQQGAWRPLAAQEPAHDPLSPRRPGNRPRMWSRDRQGFHRGDGRGIRDAAAREFRAGPVGFADPRSLYVGQENVVEVRIDFP